MRCKNTCNFVQLSKYFFIFSMIITILGALSLTFFGLNYGVDFNSGTNIDIALTKPIEKETVERMLKPYSFKKEPIVTIGTKRLNIRFIEVLDEQTEKKFRTDIKQLDSGSSVEINTVDVEIARELQRNALLAIAIASIAIIVYVSIRFEWRFAISAIIALFHDAFIVISLFSFFRLEVTLSFIVAILTIIGYSINDTIVIFDRIRENLRFTKRMNNEQLSQLVNSSIQQTWTRSINTVLTVLFMALCLFIFASESIRMFSLAILFGLVFGVYSSIFIASPLWVMLKHRQTETKSR